MMTTATVATTREAELVRLLAFHTAAPHGFMRATRNQQAHRAFIAGLVADDRRWRRLRGVA